MEIIVFISIIVGGTIIYQIVNRKGKTDALNNLDDFDIDDKFISATSKSAIAIDNKREQICLVDSKSNSSIYNYSDIFGVEVVCTTDKKIKGSKIGAVAGSIVAGKKGAMAGYLGYSKTKVKVKQLKLLVKVNDDLTPSHTIDFIATPLNSNGFMYKDAAKNLTKWKDRLDMLIEKGKRTTNNGLKSENERNQPLSISDEISKLHDLKSKGIISADEFDLQKSKLLNL